MVFGVLRIAIGGARPQDSGPLAGAISISSYCLIVREWFGDCWLVLRHFAAQNAKPLLSLTENSAAAATEVYAHLQHDPSKVAADRVSGTISAALDGNPTAESLPLRRG